MSVSIEEITADEIKKALELVSEHCENAHLRLTYQGEPFQVLVDKTINLINHYEAELEKKSAALGALLCHATGGRLSKDTYPMPVMERVVNDYIKDCCTDAENTAVKEFAELLKSKAFTHEIPFEANADKFIKLVEVKEIDNLLKERIGENNA